MGKLEELLVKYAVKVNNGSGCLFQSNKKDCTYVLTAKHCIERNDENGETLNKNEINVLSEDKRARGKKLTVEDIYSHEDKDAVILKVSPVEDINLYYASCEESDPVILFGYPMIKRGQPLESDKIDCSVNFETKEIIEIKAIEILFGYDNSTLHNVKGHSGAGVFKKTNDNNILLVGIVSRLSVPTGLGGKILVIPIANFIEIVSKYKNELSPLIPKQLATFEEYINKIWGQYEGIHKEVKTLLEDTAKEVIMKNVIPMDIFKHFKERLCIPHNIDWVSDSYLWAGWLELLTYCKLVNENINSNELEYVLELTKNKLFFYNNELKDWTSLIKEILYTDLSGLEGGASIVVNTNSRIPPLKTKLSSRFIIRIIDRAQIPGSRIKVNEGIDPVKDYNFIHLLEFKKRIGDNIKLEELGNGDKEKILDELKNSIRQVFSND